MIRISRHADFSIAIAAAAVFFIAVLTFAADSRSDVMPEMVASVYGMDSGLPNNTVRDVERTGDGYLWLATGAGLVRTDGVSFLVFDQFNTPSLGCNGILSLYLDSSDLLWVGTDGCGVYIFNGRTVKPSAVNGMLEDGHVRDLASDRHGRIWIGTERGLYCHDGERSFRYGLDEGFTDDLFTSLAIDAYGRLWAGSLRGGLVSADISQPGRLIGLNRFGRAEGLSSMAVLSLLATEDGSVWVGTMEGLFKVVEGSGSVRRIEGFPPCPVTSLDPGPQGSVLAGTMTEGIKCVAGGRVEEVGCGGVLETASINSIYRGEGGAIWAGTGSMGLVQLRSRRVEAFTSRDGLPPGGIFGVTEDEEGSLWVGTASSGLCRIIEGEVDITLSGQDGLPGSMVRALMFDAEGMLWAGSIDGGLCAIEDPERAPDGCRIRVATGLPSSDVTSLHQGEDGSIWVGTGRGLTRIEAGRPEEGGQGIWLEGESVRVICGSSGGSLLVGTRNGLWRVSGAGEEKIPIDEEGTGTEILSLLEDEDGTVWAGTGGSGLLRLTGSGVDRWTSRDGLPGDFIYSIQKGSPLVLWMSCEKGVFAVNRDNLVSYSSGSTPLIAATVLDERDGLPSQACSGYCDPAAWKRLDGTILYPAGGGVAVIDPFASPRGEKPPVVRIESIIAGSNIFDPVEFSSAGSEGRRILEIRFTAIEDSAPEKCSFIYMLSGNDEKFVLIPPGGERRASYSGLGPGDYRFIVRAASNSGQWSRDAAELSFSIPVPVYRSAGFFVSASAAAILLSAGGVFWSKREKRRKIRNKYSTIKIDDERVEQVLIELRKLMEEDKLFLDPDITLKKLSSMLKIHYNHLSRIINERFGVSFSDFINRMRIDESKVMLRDPAYSRKNILEIGFMAGFYSKSTFNGAFKKFTGTTPSKYRKEKS